MISVEHNRIVEAWRAAARDLSIDITAPFSLTVDGRVHEYLALVHHFGGGRGIVVAALPWDRAQYEDAESEDYPCSFVNVRRYSKYERAFFVETLAEWGYTGPAERRPAWLKEG